MEYPMICFCGGRPLPSGFYSRQTKYLMIGVIIHEVGHNFFPMVINNDERRWAWLDEGLNSFCQYVAEDEFEPNFPYRRGPADQFAAYSRQPKQQPIMTNPDAIRDNGKISYEKVAVGLAILRNEVMGKALFDEAFREFARRWAFRRPEPSDFFRSFEDASGMNLDWFWREWFYGVGYVEMGITEVAHFKLPAEKQPQGQIDPHLEQPASQAAEDARTYYISDKSELKDRYSETKQRSEEITVDVEGINALLEANHKADEGLFHVYQVRIKNNGSCIMPLRLLAVYHDGSRDRFQFPAEIWMSGSGEFVKSIFTTKEAVAFHLDPDHALPDVDRMNNFFPNTAIGQKILVHDLRP
jgi:Peptidase family M1 domain